LTANPKRKLPLWRYAVIAVIIALVILFFAFYALPRLSNASPTSTFSEIGTSTFNKYGIIMQSPSGVQPNIQGMGANPVSDSGGQVSWIWNNGQSGLVLVWTNAAF
jgi:hypothetical protein